MASKYQQYLRTLRRVPDDVILAIGSRDIELVEPQTCLVGWVVQETLNKLVDANLVGLSGIVQAASSKTTNRAQQLYGGTYDEWYDLYYGVVGVETVVAEIERAFVNRVIEAVNNQTEEE